MQFYHSLVGFQKRLASPTENKVGVRVRVKARFRGREGVGIEIGYSLHSSVIRKTDKIHRIRGRKRKMASKL